VLFTDTLTGCEAKNTLFFRTDYYELYGLYGTGTTAMYLKN
jgi:hypothetical protein